MKLVFAHDHIFQKDKDGKLYTGGSFNNQAWKRYLKHYEKVEVLARLQDISDLHNNKKYNNFDLPNMSFAEIPSLGGPLKQVRNSKEARNLIRKSLLNADALIARLPSETGNLAIEIAKENNIPYAVEVVACVWDALWNHGNLLGKVYAPFAYLKMRNRVKKSKYTLYVTEHFLQKRYPSHGQITNVSNVEIESINYDAIEIRNKRFASQKTFKIGMIGSLKNNIKGWDVAFQALKKLKGDKINFVFYCLGDGEIEQWQEMVNDLNLNENVVFCGVLPGGEPVLNWLDELDLYIQPSYQEGLPRAVIEAMSRGCPVVGSNAGGIPELINPQCIHSKGDSEQLYINIKNVLGNHEFAMDLTRDNIEEAEKYLKEKLDSKRELFWNEFIQANSK